MLPGRRCRPTREGLGSGEELVHDLGAGGDDGSRFAAVDDLGSADGGVPGQAAGSLSRPTWAMGQDLASCAGQAQISHPI